LIFQRIAIIGFGLIGSSIARRCRAHAGLAQTVICIDRAQAVCDRALELGLAMRAGTTLDLVEGCDLVILATPIGAFAELAPALAERLRPGVLLTDVGSVKTAAIRDLAPFLPKGVHFIPGHPIAGTEHSGPDAGLADLFEGRWCILTPPADADAEAVARLSAFWRGCGSQIEIMDAAKHDRILAITSHLPHLIAYTIVGTATDLEDELKSAVIRFSASGFRDFTRIAASDPVMWRDIFLNNREATLEIIQRFTEDLTALQKAIRRGDAQTLENLFTRTRTIRRSIIDARQA
jgi:cyclohexadieny/prephenate dehydrogenase